MATRTARVACAAALVIGCADGDTGPMNPITGELGTSGSSTTLDVDELTSSTSIDPPSTFPDDASTSNVEGTTEAASSTGVDLGDGEACVPARTPCTSADECCVDDGYTCDTTTLGQVCCGNEGAACGTPNGEDCCGQLLCVAGLCLPAGAVPPFAAPFTCGESWTYSHHSAEVRRALDFINDAGGTDNAPALAAAAGVATQHYEAGGAGNYIVIDHWGGWTTYYFHLQSFSVDDGAWVEQGDEVGRIGSTGASSGPHLHFEELYQGGGQDIWLDGALLAPYPGTYGQASHVSQNCP